MRMEMSEPHAKGYTMNPVMEIHDTQVLNLKGMGHTLF